MSVPFLPKLRPAGCGDPGDDIPYACLFAGGYLTRTPAAVGSRTAWGVSMWIKRLAITDAPAVMLSTSINENISEEAIEYLLHRLCFHDGQSQVTQVTDTAVQRDPSGYRHVLVTYDAAQPDQSRRGAIVVDGVRVNAGTAISQGRLSYLWRAVAHRIGQYVALPPGYAANCLLAEIVGIEGRVPLASEFGYRNRYGIWVPRRFAGRGQGAAAYGAQGWHIDFGDPLDLGHDVSGNGNHWTSVGLTVANRVTDTPTHGYATINPLLFAPGSAAITVSDGGQKVRLATPNTTRVFSAFPLHPGSGRWYWEWQPTATTEAGGYTVNINCVASPVAPGASGTITLQHTEITGNYNVGKIFGCIYDSDTGNYWVRVNGGAWLGGGDPDAGTAPTGTVDPTKTYRVGVSHATGNTTTSDHVLWFGQRGFNHALPTRAKALNTVNLPCPPIKRPERYATTRLRSGGAAVADLPWSPLDRRTIVISKRLDGSTDWRVNDSAKPGRVWAPNLTAADFVEADGITFTASGYTLGAAAAYQGAREDWIFRVASAAGFDVVDVVHVTGAPTTVPHAAGGIIDYAWVVPLTGGDRRVYLRGLAAGQYVVLNTAVPYATQAGWFASSAVDLTIGAAMPSGTYRVLAWRSVPGFSWFGTFIGNGSTDGAFIPLDFAPAMMHSRPIHTTTGLWLYDTARNPSNPVNRLIGPSETSGDHVTTDYVDLLADGVKWRTGSNDRNASGQTHILAAWAEATGKFARAR